MTSKDILRYNREIRASREQTQDDRNNFCVLRVNELLKLNGVYNKETKLDGILVYSNQTQSEFEVIESSPCEEDIVKMFSPILEYGTGVVGDLTKYTNILVNEALNKKETKFYSKPEDINLIIYINPPGGIPDSMGLSWAIPINLEDFDINYLNKISEKSSFGSIIILNDSNCFFIKNKDVVRTRLIKY